MKKIGVVSYNIYCNFTNYGSALQSWSLSQAIKKCGYEAILIDYCPNILADIDPLNPFKNMWDQDEESQRMCQLSIPAIQKNYQKFDAFYSNHFNRSKKYTSINFNDSIKEVDSYICGSDTIFCIDEFGFDDGYYANYPVMKKNTVSYAASFGDSVFTDKSYKVLDDRISNFKALGIRENKMIPYLKKHTCIPVQRTIDPTFLLSANEYNEIISAKKENEKYLLLYSRRYSPNMEKYAEKLSLEYGWKIIDISLRAINVERGHQMAYDAGIEEFLSLVKHAEFVVTNSFHGMIFSIQFRRPFVIFSREQCDSKIVELSKLLGVHSRVLSTGDERLGEIDYDSIHNIIEVEREKSFNFLKMELGL